MYTYCVTLLFVTFFNRIKSLKEQNTIVLVIYIPFLRNLSQCYSPLHNNTCKWYSSKAIVAPSFLYLIKEQACTIILFFQCCYNFWRLRTLIRIIFMLFFNSLCPHVNLIYDEKIIILIVSL